MTSAIIAGTPASTLVSEQKPTRKKYTKSALVCGVGMNDFHDRVLIDGRAIRSYDTWHLEQYNAIINGEVYGIVTEVFDEHGGFISCDHCWGYVGSEGTAEEMKTQFDATCKGEEK